MLILLDIFEDLATVYFEKIKIQKTYVGCAGIGITVSFMQVVGRLFIVHDDVDVVADFYTFKGLLGQ